MIILLVIPMLLLPDVAYAWGPLTHLKLGAEVLETPLLPPAILHLLREFPYYFLYGNISADVILWKNKIKYSRHCHNWKIGFEVLARAHTQPLKAFAYGYLSHLAADIIAHNFFIPREILLHYPQRRGKHISWEIRYDRWIDGNMWKIFRKIPKEIDTSCDDLLEDILERKIFSYSTNKRIFTAFVTLQRLGSLRRFVKKEVGSPSHESLRYYQLSFNAIVSVLSRGKSSPYTKIDPTGILPIQKAEKLRKALKGIKGERRERERRILLQKIEKFQPSMPVEVSLLPETSGYDFQYPEGKFIL